MLSSNENRAYMVLIEDLNICFTHVLCKKADSRVPITGANTGETSTSNTAVCNGWADRRALTFFSFKTALNHTTQHNTPMSL